MKKFPFTLFFCSPTTPLEHWSKNSRREKQQELPSELFWNYIMVLLTIDEDLPAPLLRTRCPEVLANNPLSFITGSLPYRFSSALAAFTIKHLNDGTYKS
ncbi:MAG: hypothetical protein WCH05_04275 [Chlorobiaceae bacterium]